MVSKRRPFSFNLIVGNRSHMVPNHQWWPWTGRGFPGSSVTTSKQKAFILFYNAHDNFLNTSYVYLTSVTQHIISVALVSHRHVVTSKNMSLGWCLKDNNSHSKFSYCLSAGLFWKDRQTAQWSKLFFSERKVCCCYHNFSGASIAPPCCNIQELQFGVAC
jgi:hypothetical protein